MKFTIFTEITGKSALLFSIVFVLTSCQGINLPSTPTNTNQATSTTTPILTKTMIPTLTPTIIPSSTSTSSTIPPNQPNIGDPFWLWGGNSDTYQVWINNLKLMCGQWICPNDNSNHLYNKGWVYVGQANGNATFTFPFPAKDIVISLGTGKMFAFDALLGKVGDETVGYGFTLDGDPSATWMDGSDTISMKTLITFDFPNCTLLKPSGMVGITADHNYNISENRGGILFRFIDTPCKKLLLMQRPVDVGDSSYLVNGLSVFAKPTSQLDSTDIISP
jgi:hypothetical protein